MWTNLVDSDLNIVQCEWIDHELRSSQKTCIIEKKSYYINCIYFKEISAYFRPIIKCLFGYFPWKRNNLPQLNISPDNIQVEIKDGESILTACLRNNISHLHACGGMGRCSTCRIAVSEGIENCTPANKTEQILAKKIDLPPEFRLACQTEVTGDVHFRRLLLDKRDLVIASQLNKGKYGPVGTSRKPAIMFSDIRGFTPFTESVSSYDIMYILNRYFDIMGEVIIRNGGEINNYIGDAILAFFGLEDSGDPIFRCIKAGVEMLEAMDEFKPYLEKSFGKTFDIGVGIHYGDAIVGMVGTGSSQRLTVIGETVNTASRIESANKEAGTRLLISEEAYEQVKDRVEVEDFVRMKLKGTSLRKTLYEISKVIGETTAKQSESIRFSSGHKWHKTLPVEDLEPGEKKKFIIGSENLLLVNLEDQFYAVNNACPHMHLPLDTGQISDKGTILCPFHDSEFCIKTGEAKRWAETMPDGIPENFAHLIKNIKVCPLKTFPVQIEDGFIWICMNEE